MRPSSVDPFLSADPVELGSILFTLVEPHRGHEVDYNRWYERDHFYAGCMIGPWNFGGGRFVATKQLKDLRTPSDHPGSFLALYWVLKGHHESWNRWARRQVKVLLDNDRMFSHRDHIHTQLYTYEWGAFRDADPVPAELALDHPFRGLAVVMGRAAEGTPRDEVGGWYRSEHLPNVLAGSSAAMCLCFHPIPMPPGQPSDVPSSDDDERRWLHLYFLDRTPDEVWASEFARHDDDLGPRGEVTFASPFIPTVPGTDTYTDQLW